MKTSDNESAYELAGEYVLGTLPEADRRAVIERLKTDPELAELVTYWEEKLVPLCDVIDPMPLPDNVWARINNSAQPEVSAAAHDKQPKPPLLQTWWHNLPLWRGLTAASFATALLLGVTLSGQSQQHSYMVVLATPEGHSPGWVVQASNRQTLTLKALGSYEVPQGKSLEFWTKADDWAAPVSLGLVKPGQTLSINLDKLPPLEQNQLFEITLEDEAGSPIGKPTGPIEYIGRAIPI